jgi:NAD(P)-dependent dehydrogenase (short-subunit alcohol dehydrogenase family)
MAGSGSSNGRELAGKLCVVTGGNRGIGYEVARLLAERGAHVVIACRQPARMQRAEHDLARLAPGRVEGIELDLSSLAAVKRAADALRTRHARVDVLVNNAGVLAVPERRTADGFELNFGVNHLGHFAWTGLLLPALLGAPGARVVSVSSVMHRGIELDLDDLPRPRVYRADRAYGASKLCTLLFAYELQRRLRRSGANALSVACHPGYTEVDVREADPESRGPAWRELASRALKRAFGQRAADGALPCLHATTAAELRGGEFVGPAGLFGLRGAPRVTRSSAASHDRASAERLWDLSETLSGVRFAF